MPNSKPTTMEDKNGSVAIFDSEDEAEKCAEKNPLGLAFGWKVYEWAIRSTPQQSNAK